MKNESCRNCGKESWNDEKICPHCGKDKTDI